MDELSTFRILNCDYPILLTIRQVSEITGFSEKTIRNWLSKGQCPFPVHHYGRSIRVWLVDLANWIENPTKVQNTKKRGRPRKRG